MKLFRHYKNKPYKYIGVAKHSETLDDLVVYEALYENSHGKLWVRPKTMFFENVTKDQKTFRRFQEVPLEIKTRFNMGLAEVEEIWPLLTKVFGPLENDHLKQTYESYQKFLVLLGYIDSKLVGFKLGYQKDQKTFYSWLGALTQSFEVLELPQHL